MSLKDGFAKVLTESDAADKRGECSILVVRAPDGKVYDRDSGSGQHYELRMRTGQVGRCGKPAHRFLEGQRPVCAEHYAAKRAQLERDLKEYVEATEQHSGRSWFEFEPERST